MENVFTVKNPSGMHARPATALVQKATSFPCDIFISKEGKKVNVKSIMGVMTLALQKGDQVTVTTQGEQEEEEEEALAAMGQVIETVFE